MNKNPFANVLLVTHGKCTPCTRFKLKTRLDTLEDLAKFKQVNAFLAFKAPDKDKAKWVAQKEWHECFEQCHLRNKNYIIGYLCVLGKQKLAMEWAGNVQEHWEYMKKLTSYLGISLLNGKTIYDSPVSTTRIANSNSFYLSHLPTSELLSIAHPNVILFSTAKSGNASIIKQLPPFKQGEVLSDDFYFYLEDYIYKAYKYNHQEIVPLILEHTKMICDPFEWVCITGQVDQVKSMLLHMGHYIQMSGIAGVAIRVAMLNHDEVFQLLFYHLLNSGNDYHAFLVFHNLCRKGNTRQVSQIIQHFERDITKSMLECAYHCRYETFLLLLKHIEKNIEKDRYYNAILKDACHGGDVRIVNSLMTYYMQHASSMLLYPQEKLTQDMSDSVLFDEEEENSNEEAKNILVACVSVARRKNHLPVIQKLLPLIRSHSSIL
jgi:hypothetical protein